MSDVTAKALISVYAQTAPAVSEMKKLEDSTKKVGAETEKAGSSISKFVGSAVEGFGKFNLALGGVQKAFGLLNGAVDTAIDVKRREALEKMLPAGTVDRFRESTEKLIARQDILRLSIKGMHGDFKITETEMQKVLKAAVALEQRGFGPAAETADKLIDALVNGVNKLDDFGINLEKTKNFQNDVNAAMGKFDELIRDTPIDEQTKSLKQLKDNLLEIGQALASIVSAAASAISWIKDNWDEYAGDFFGEPELRGARAGQATAEANMRNRGSFWEDAARGRDFFDTLDAVAAGSPLALEEIRGTGTLTPGAAPGAVVPGRRPTNRPGRAPPSRGSLFEAGRGIEGGLGTGYGVGGADEGTFSTGSGARLWEGRAGNYDMGVDANAPGTKAAEFMRKLGDSATFAGGAFNVFQDSFTAAVTAAIDGSEGIARAFAKAAQAGLKALAVEYAVRALGEGAWALASLAYGDGKGAALHGAAALKFGVAAAAAGVGAGIAGALAGGGGGGSSQAAGGGYASPTGGSSGGGGPVNVTVNVGFGFDGDSRQIEEAVRRGVRGAQLKGGRDNNYATRVSG